MPTQIKSPSTSITDQILMCGPGVRGADCGSILVRPGYTYERLPKICSLQLGKETTDKICNNPDRVFKVSAEVISICVAPVFYNGRLLPNATPNYRILTEGSFRMDRGGHFNIVEEPTEVNIPLDRVKKILGIAARSIISEADPSYRTDIEKILASLNQKNS